MSEKTLPSPDSNAYGIKILSVYSINENIPKTIAERARDYRKRKKLFTNEIDKITNLNNRTKIPGIATVDDSTQNPVKISSVNKNKIVISKKKQPKTGAERAREYRERKKQLRLSQCKKQNKFESSGKIITRQSKTGAERAREYRARKRQLRLGQYKKHQKNLEYPICDHESLPKSQSIPLTNVINLNQTSNSTESSLKQLNVPPYIKEQDQPSSKIKKRQPKTGAERAREYRARKRQLRLGQCKKHQKNLEYPICDHESLPKSQSIPLTNVINLNQTSNSTENSLHQLNGPLHIDVQDKFVPSGEIKKRQPKSNAQCNREYRARKKLLRNNQQNEFHSLPGGVEPSYSNQAKQTLVEDAPKMLITPASLLKSMNIKQLNIKQETSPLSTVNSSIQTIDADHIFPVKKKIPKSAAQRVREYRARKKLLMNNQKKIFQIKLDTSKSGTESSHSSQTLMSPASLSEWITIETDSQLLKIKSEIDLLELENSSGTKDSLDKVSSTYNISKSIDQHGGEHRTRSIRLQDKLVLLKTDEECPLNYATDATLPEEFIVQKHSYNSLTFSSEKNAVTDLQLTNMIRQKNDIFKSEKRQPKSSAQRSREYRERKRLLLHNNNQNKTPKTCAERSRKYRENKKRLLMYDASYFVECDYGQN